MKNKTLIVGGAAAALILAAVSASRLKRLAKEFVIEFSMRVKASLSPLAFQLLCDVLFKNPTDAQITVKHPTVSIFETEGAVTANTPLATSEITGKSYFVERNSQKKFDPITFNIGLSHALVAFRLCKSYIAGKPVVLYIRAITTVNGAAPIEQVQKIELVKGKQSGLGEVITETITRTTNIYAGQLRQSPKA